MGFQFGNPRLNHVFFNPSYANNYNGFLGFYRVKKF